MQVFGCRWKINFSEVIWSWQRKWAFDHGNGLKLKFSLQTIFGSDVHRERERERARTHERKPRSRLQRRRRTPSSSPTIACTRSPVQQLHAPVRRSRGSPDHMLQSANHTLQSDDQEEAQIARSSLTIDLTFNLAPLDPPISLCDFDFCCCCGGVVVVFWWLWILIAGVCCRGLNWSFGGVWCWDLAVILKFFVIKFVWMLRK